MMEGITVQTRPFSNTSNSIEHYMNNVIVFITYDQNTDYKTLRIDIPCV
jgi:hypothetical protein